MAAPPDDPDKDQINLAFGRALRAIRREQGMSQEALSFAADHHRTYLSSLERGQHAPTLWLVFDLSRALNVTPTEFVRKVEDELGAEL